MLTYALILAAISAILYSQSAPKNLSRAPLPALNEDMLAIPSSNDTLGCPPDQYSVHIYSKEPLVIYIENFLSTSDQEHLLDVSEDLFQPSTVTHDGSSTQIDPSIRLSEVALLPRDPTVRCIEARARAFQGWRRNLWIERLRTQRYGPGGHYGMHFDWSSGAGGWGRVSSFMAWAHVSDDIQGGGTEFPYLPRAEVRSGNSFWCTFVECDASSTSSPEGGNEQQDILEHRPAVEGVIFKPILGNAVFWENFRADGSGKGYQETFHAGLPVKQGSKVGLNIWTWGALE
ncbi:hypothetical protein Cpir12675_003189 [Ceratocystis pirilliformis]|uniref:Prolyl 4-hydroxylase alpha subunit domain-containing protein n=1 Tax=Ceratocystis pirilliformis TaxID=259994 RepID=A0ABR3Z4J7_9PEZI